MEKRRGSRKMSRLAPPTPRLRREGGKFHGLLLVNHVAGLRRMGQNYLLWSSKPPVPGTCRAAPLAVTWTASCLLVIRCPDIRGEARAFFRFCGCYPKRGPIKSFGFGEWLAGAALERAVARNEKSLIKAGTPPHPHLFSIF